MRPFVAATLCALIAAGLAVQTLLGAGLDRGPRIRAVRPMADAFVSEVNRTQNFGHARDLKVDSSPTFRTYVLFKVDLRSIDVEAGQPPALQPDSLASRISGSSCHGALAGAPHHIRKRTSTPVRALSRRDRCVPGAWKAVDVTSLISGDEKGIGFVLTSVSPKGAEFASRETGLRGPRLIVEREDNGTTQSTTTDGEGLPTP